MAYFKLKSLIFLTLSTLFLLLLPSATLRFGGSPGARTGSPGDNSENCTSCHSDNQVISKSDLISLNLSGNEYIPGQIYTLTIDMVHIGAQRIGFEITAENNLDEKINTFEIINNELTQFTNDSNSVTHTSKGTIAKDSVKWEMNWTAPDVGAGDITFYLAVNATNSDLSSSGDQVYLSNYTIKEEGTTHNVTNAEIANQVNLFPVPVKDFLNIKINQNLNIRQLYILDVFGKKVSSFNINLKHNYRNEIDLRNIYPGFYLLVLEAENQIITKKLYKL